MCINLMKINGYITIIINVYYNNKNRLKCVFVLTFAKIYFVFFFKFMHMQTSTIASVIYSLYISSALILIQKLMCLKLHTM